MGEILEPQRKRSRRGRELGAHWMRLGLERIERVTVRGARTHMRMGRCKEGLAGAMRQAVVDARHPAVAGENRCCMDRVVERCARDLIVFHEIAQTFGKSAMAAAPAPFGPADPAAELAHL